LHALCCVGKRCERSFEMSSILNPSNLQTVHIIPPFYKFLKRYNLIFLLSFEISVIFANINITMLHRACSKSQVNKIVLSNTKNHILNSFL